MRLECHFRSCSSYILFQRWNTSETWIEQAHDVVNTLLFQRPFMLRETTLFKEYGWIERRNFFNSDLMPFNSDFWFSECCFLQRARCCSFDYLGHYHVLLTISASFFSFSSCFPLRTTLYKPSETLSNYLKSLLKFHLVSDLEVYFKSPNVSLPYINYRKSTQPLHWGS